MTPIYSLTYTYVNTDSCDTVTETVAFSTSIDTLKSKATDINKNIWDEMWITDKDSLLLTIGKDLSTEIYCISTIKLI